MFLPTMIKLAESGVNMMSKPGTSAAKTDDKYYPTKALTPEERQLAMALLAEQTLPEGSIFVLYPDKAKAPDPDKAKAPDPDKAKAPETPKKTEKADKEHAFGFVPDLYAEKGKEKFDFGKPSGRERGAEFARKFLNNPDHPDWAEIDTVVIPGCGSSPLGAAALGKTVANMYEKKVAAIVAGQGAFDQWFEATSGGMLMAPTANALNFYDKLLELTAEVNPLAAFAAKFYVNDLLDAMHEAATLFALLKARLVNDNFNNLNMIVSHSKGNWAVLVALLALELEHAQYLATKYKGKNIEPPIDVVTFGNPVDLPDMKPIMKKLFHYHQFVGAIDPLAHFCSWRAWKLQCNGDKKLDAEDPVLDPKDGPIDRMVANTGHHLVAHTDPEFWPYHMPIEDILPQIRPTTDKH